MDHIENTLLSPSINLPRHDALDALAWDPSAAQVAPHGLPVINHSLLSAVAAHVEVFAAALAPAERAALDALLSLAAGDGHLAALAAEPPEALLTPAERREYERLAAEELPAAPPLRPSLVLIMKGTRLCDLRCSYCYSWGVGPNQTMSFPVLARALRDALRAPGVRHVEFVWHGGEPTLMPIAFYRKALWLQAQFRRPEQQVENRVQTNAAHLNDHWLDFWRRYRFSVGISLDGPPSIHDRRRVDVRGRPTAARVRAGLERLQQAGLDPSVYVVVDDDIITLGAEALLDYLLELDVRRAGVLNVVPGGDGSTARGMELAWARYVEFLRDLFRAWWPHHRQRLVIRELADLARQVGGRTPLVCLFAGDCHGGYLTIEPTGVVSDCDKFLDDEAYRYGNLFGASLAEILASPRLVRVQIANGEAAARLRACPWFAACHGGCPYDRGVRTRAGHRAEGCCGLAPLLNDIAEALRRDGLTPATGPLPGGRTRGKEELPAVPRHLDGS